MTCRVADVIHAIEQLAPLDMASPWDNAGLQVGACAWTVQTVWVALDPLPDVVSDACEADVDMLVTHHPLIFKALKAVDVATPEGAIIQSALQHRMAIYAAHTNLDTVKDGINDTLALKIGLKNIAPLDASLEGGMQDFLRVGFLSEEITLISFARMIKEYLGVESIRISGNAGLKVKKAAVCSGSGSSLLSAFFISEADVFVSGDLKYHDARAIESAGKGLVDIGHFASEHVMLEVFSKRLGQCLMNEGKNVRVEPYRFEKDPFVAV
jgi:dinuclear metal center YbgI/SA1388 family protein